MSACRATVQSEAGTEHCEGRSGHRTHWYKIHGRGGFELEKWPNKKWCKRRRAK